MSSGTLQALSVRQPWARLIIHGHGAERKDYENRTWGTKHRGRLLIHASQTWDSVGAAYLRGAPGFACSRRSQCVRGALLGVVELVDCHRPGSGPVTKWRDIDAWGWELENPRPLPNPVPYPGQLRLFEVPRAELGEQIQFAPPVLDGQKSLFEREETK